MSSHCRANTEKITPTIKMKTYQKSCCIPSLRFAITLSIWVVISPISGQNAANASTEVSPDMIERLQIIEARLKEIEAAPNEQEAPAVENNRAQPPGRPEQILRSAEKMVTQQRYREAYLMAKQVRGAPAEELSDDTEADACLIAAQLAGINYRMARFKEPKSIWVLTEPEATFQWVCSLQNIEDDKMRILVTTLLRNTPTQFWRRFETFQKDHFPDQFPWKIEVELDNGKVESVAFSE